MRLLLLSNSKNSGENYLDFAMDQIVDFIGTKSANIVFIPFAAITVHYDEYADKVAKRFYERGLNINSIHTYSNPVNAITDADLIIVGGGNTWQLLHTLQIKKLLSVIREKVLSGTPYIGWSAGSNICCPTIKTTNDMPVVECENLLALSLIPFQINPHYIDSIPEGFSGETREERIREFIHSNRNLYVLGLREGSIIRIEDQNIRLVGTKTARLFRFGMDIREIVQSDDLGFLLNHQ
jgi:dipeptidase E